MNSGEDVYLSRNATEGDGLEGGNFGFSYPFLIIHPMPVYVFLKTPLVTPDELGLVKNLYSRTIQLPVINTATKKGFRQLALLTNPEPASARDVTREIAGNLNEKSSSLYVDLFERIWTLMFPPAGAPYEAF